MIAALETREKQVNIARRLADAAARLPQKPAIIEPSGRQVTFQQLEDLAARSAGGLAQLGIERGMRVLVMVPPSIEFFSLTFALFRLGALPVMIDPGMGRKGLLRAIEEAEPAGMIGIPKAHLARRLFPKSFAAIKYFVTVGRRWFWGGATAEQLKSSAPRPLAETLAGETAAILFTSGSTGAAKGVTYTHGIFDAQVEIIGREWGIAEDELDLPAFPLFALFSAGLGVTSVLPDMDASRPGKVDPRRIVAAVKEHRPTYSFGSPAFWTRVADYCAANNRRLDSLRRVFVAGAPVAPRLVEKIKNALPAEAEVMIPYGATESLPVAWIRGAEVAALRARSERGEGLCVGRPIAESEVRIIAIDDDPLDHLPPALAPREIGEITVRGRVTTPSYHRRPDADAAAKIRAESGLWHRTGDLGFFDEDGRLWYTGRKSHRVETARETLHSICCEIIFDQHPKVQRSALVGIGKYGQQKPVIVIESKSPGRPLAQELLALAESNPTTRAIETILFYPHPLPTDIRHNAKIRRELLAEWAAEWFRR